MKVCTGVRITLLCGLLAVLPVKGADDPAAAERDLAKVRERIETLQTRISRDQSRRSRAERELVAAEQSEAKARQQVAATQAERDRVANRLAALTVATQRSREALDVELQTLERQLRGAYLGGQAQWLRAVLSQESPTDLGRTLIYYQYLASHRSELVAGVRDTLAELDNQRAETEAEQARLDELDARQRKALAEVAAARETRKVALAKLDRDIRAGSGEIDNLTQRAAELENLVEELTRAVAGLPVGAGTPFAKSRGRLAWPAAGSVIGDFGQPRGNDGRLRWDGVLLGASAGSEVVAVHHGRVVFADWLTGLGLLVIVDHGGGYLTLYGHNQDVVKDIGDPVAAGEVIAHVGDSGGQSVPGLYFEIRHQGRPVNPHKWISK